MPAFRLDSSEIPLRLQERLGKIQFLTDGEVRRLFAVIADKRDRAMFLVAYRHGLRASEVGLLRLTDLDLKKLRLRIRRLNSASQGEHVMQTDERRTLKSYILARDAASPVLFVGARGSPISRRGLDWLIKRYGTATRLPPAKLHFHALRHSIAAHMLGAGAELRLVQDWLGHSNIHSNGYLRLSDSAHYTASGGTGLCEAEGILATSLFDQ